MTDAFSDAQRDAQEIAARRRNATDQRTRDVLEGEAAPDHPPAPTSSEEGGERQRARDLRSPVEDLVAEKEGLRQLLQAAREENARNWNSGYKAGQEQMEDELQAAREEIRERNEIIVAERALAQKRGVENEKLHKKNAMMKHEMGPTATHARKLAVENERLREEIRQAEKDAEWERGCKEDAIADRNNLAEQIRRKDEALRTVEKNLGSPFVRDYIRAALAPPVPDGCSICFALASEDCKHRSATSPAQDTEAQKKEDDMKWPSDMDPRQSPFTGPQG